MLPPIDLLVRAATVLAILVGMVVRRRVGTCVSFTAYLALALLGAGCKMAGLVDWTIWGTIAALQAGASLATALEVAARTYHHELPGARAALGHRLLLGLALGLVAVVAWARVPPPMTPGEAYDSLYELDRRLNALAGWLCAVVLAFSAYNWTLDAWHRDVLAGLLFYRLGFIVLSTLPLSPRWPTWLFAMTLSWWLLAAWRRDERLPDWPSWLIALVFPWRARP